LALSERKKTRENRCQIIHRIKKEETSRGKKRKALWGGRPFTGEYSRGTDYGY